MARNVEIKARVRDMAGLRRIVEQVGEFQGVLEQRDTFFNCPNGRLKLRQFGDGTAEIMLYQRENSNGPKECEYWKCPVGDAEGLKTVLSQAYGLAGTVVKKRQLYLAGQSRLHLDEVEGLGTFFEIEVVLTPQQSADEGQRIAVGLMRQLGIDEGDLLTNAYVDMICG